MTEYRFTGRERITIELDGVFDPAALAVPPGIALELAGDGRARVRLFAFFVEGIRIAGVPFVRSSYPEVLWRIAVSADGAPAWWVNACDLGARGARWAAARWVRYPVRAGEVEVSAARVAVRGAAGELAITVGSGGAPVKLDHRVLLTGTGAGWRVPWGDDGLAAQAAPVRIEADSLSAATVGAPVEWAAAALVRHGREHRCGMATPRLVSGASMLQKG